MLPSCDDDDDEYEESGGNQLLGFMFGNVDNSGDLDVDYLDEDAKEHLSALADKLGPSLTDIDLSEKSSNVPADIAEQDYDAKAEDAVDYEDIEEQYEGPEIQATSEEDYLLPKKDYFSSEVSLAAVEHTNSVFDDENYDEDVESENNQGAVERKDEITPTISGGHLVDISEEEKSPECDRQLGLLNADNQLEVAEDFQEVVADVIEGPLNGKSLALLPVLCIEDGMVILRFSEIFGIHEPLKKEEKRGHRYFTYREKYKSMATSDLFEEDEEAFLKADSQGFSIVKEEEAVKHDFMNDDGSDLVRAGAVGGDASIPSQVGEPKKDSCISGEPMEDLTFSFSTGWQSQLCAIFPLDQQEWEQRILWDDSPVISDNSQSCEHSGPNLEGRLIGETEPEVGIGKNVQMDLIAKPDRMDHNSFVHNHPVLLESFGSDKPSAASLPVFEGCFHPQLLRLESRLEVGVSNHGDDGQENLAVELLQADALRHINKLTLQNRDVMEESWLDDIIWEPHKSISKPKLILDLQDEQMLFEILDNKDGGHLEHHAGAMILSRSAKPTSGDSFELHGCKYQSGWQFNISNDKSYINGKTFQQLQSNSNKRMVHSFKIHHSAPALKLQTMKLKLSNKDIAYFHRPKAMWYPHDNEVAVKEQGKLPTQGPMKIIVKSLGGKGTKLNVDVEETVFSVKAKASKKLDFKPIEAVKMFYLGKELEDDKALASQNVQSNSLIHLVRTRVHLWPRAQKLPGENKSLRPPGAFKKKSDLSVKDGHVVLMEYCEERPLLLSNAGMGANLCTYYQKSGPGDQGGNLLNGNNSLGNILILEPGEKSPFLGDIRAGCSQSSLETNMYKAPIFPHKVPSTDYLLVRSAKGKLSIRRIDKIAVVGQQEPLMEVMSPASKNLQTYMVNRMLVYIYREFARGGLHPSIGVDELSLQFNNLSEAIIRKKMKECASLRKDRWYMKSDFVIPSENELRKMVTPEHMCAYESMQAGLYRLKHLGITRLTLPTSISSAMTQLPDEAIALAAACHIERELQITPWNLSSNFVSCTNQDRGNIERLEITGVGDPSGRGLGFSYVRAAPKAPMPGALSKKKTVPGRGGTTVTGTDADLRRLSMEAAREVLLKFNVPEELIAKQTRWHRIAMIRKLSSEQAASGVKVDPTTISKYARGQRMSFLQLQQQTREKCQEIWDRQVQSLSAVNHDENESDSEANSDLDSFAGDLENLLDAEECEEGEEGNYSSKHDKLDGVKGLKMRRRPSQVQAEEEIEDEAAEAAELRRLLIDDDDELKKKKKKTKALAEKVVYAPSLRTSAGQDIPDRMKRTAAIAKKIINTTQTDGFCTKDENIVTDPMDVESSMLKCNISGKEKAMKKNGILPTGQLKKVKILGDKVKMFKVKKSARESFVCGACGQLGHMRTNKNCPKYGEDIEAQMDTTDLEKSAAKPSPLDPSAQSQSKGIKKKIVSKSATKIAVVEAPGVENSNSKAKVLPLKFRCGPADKQSDKVASGVPQSFDQTVIPDAETGSKSVKVSKIIISSRARPEDLQVQSDKPWPPVDIDRSQVDSHKRPILIRPLVNAEREQTESHKHSLVIRPPMKKDKDQPKKKIIIKRPKEVNDHDHDQNSQDGSPQLEHRKTKRIVELSGFQRHGKLENLKFSEESSKRKAREERRWWEEDEKRRTAEREREERERRLYEEEMRVLEERERFAEIKRYEDAIRKEREEEERQKAKNKKKKKKKVEIGEDYLDDYRARRNDRRIPERDRTVKRRPVVELDRYGAEYAPPTKRRRGGEVGLANILERIVETLRDNTEVSFLFLKPVTKKEAPDYLDVIERPMALSTIRDKVRRMEYKNRDEFRHDVWQIAYNAHTYNDRRNPGIPPLADQLLELCDYLLDENHDSLHEAEAGIESRG